MTAQAPELIERARRGDRASLDGIIREMTPGIYRFALRMTRSEEEARDIAQETFLRMFMHLDRYDPAYSFQTWLYRIARNLCIDRARRRSRWGFFFRKQEEDDVDPLETIADPTSNQLEGVLSLEQKGEVEGALQRLKPSYREVLVLYHFEELSYQEIAAVLEIPIGTVMNRIFRARQQLKELLLSGPSV